MLKPVGIKKDYTVGNNVFTLKGVSLDLRVKRKVVIRSYYEKQKS